ncbi:MAG: hypothetical protein JNM46_06660 [Anaerolineales bacterium]|nr:hypothetical protein [Anaerolineales bacterium]
MDSHKFTYTHKIWKIMSDFVSLAISLVLFYFGLVAFQTYISDNDFFFALIYFVGFSIWSPFIFLAMTFWYADVEIKTEGLLVHFIFKSLLIEWEDISLIKPAQFFGIGSKSWGSIVVVKKGLTQFHRIYGIVYALTQNPAFLIVSSIRDYEELISIIKNNIKKTKEKTKKKTKEK